MGDTHGNKLTLAREPPPLPFLLLVLFSKLQLALEKNQKIGCRVVNRYFNMQEISNNISNRSATFAPIYHTPVIANTIRNDETGNLSKSSQKFSTRQTAWRKIVIFLTL